MSVGRIAAALREMGIINVHGCLRGCPGGPHSKECAPLYDAMNDCASEHAQEVRDVETLLRPFACAWREWWPKRITDWDENTKAWPTVTFTFGDLRRAREYFGSASPSAESPAVQPPQTCDGSGWLRILNDSSYLYIEGPVRIEAGDDSFSGESVKPADRERCPGCVSCQPKEPVDV